MLSLLIFNFLYYFNVERIQPFLLINLQIIWIISALVIMLIPGASISMDLCAIFLYFYRNHCSFTLFFEFLFTYLLTLLTWKIYFYLFLAVLGFPCWVWAYFSCGEWGLLASGSVGFSLWWRLIVEDRFCDVHASVVVACGLSSRGTWA